MEVLGGGGLFLMSEVPLYWRDVPGLWRGRLRLSSDDVFQEQPGQWLQCHPEAGSSWPSWPQASHCGREQQDAFHVITFEFTCTPPPLTTHDHFHPTRPLYMYSTHQLNLRASLA